MLIRLLFQINFHLGNDNFINFHLFLHTIQSCPKVAKVRNYKLKLFVKMVKRYCYICCKIVDYKGSMKEHQDSEHVEDIKNSKISNSMAEVVRSSCKVCGEHVKVTDMRNHTKKSS